MDQPSDLLGSICGGRVLDVATGSGGFIHFLLDGLKEYTEIIGIDTNQRAAIAFAEGFKEKPAIRFMPMDALNLDFLDSTFDTVCISNSLHHFDQPQVVLGEIARVLRPGGHFILSEMYRDGQTETQMTHVHLHHWWAAVDRVCGIIHNETYRREDLVAMLDRWHNLKLYDLADTTDDPKKSEILAELAPVFDRYIQRAEGHPELQALGQQLRRRVEEIGFHGASTLFALGQKT